MVFLGYFCGLLIGTWVHELGHVVAARLCGRTVYNVVIGYGHRIISFRTGSTFVDLGSNLFGGYVLSASPKRGGLWGVRLLLLGGVLANIIFGVAVGLIANSLTARSHLAAEFCFGICLAQVWMAVRNLWPWANSLPNHRFPRDGVQLVATFRNSDKIPDVGWDALFKTSVRRYSASDAEPVLTPQVIRVMVDDALTHFIGKETQFDIESQAIKGESSEASLPIAVVLYLIDREVTKWLLIGSPRHLDAAGRVTDHGMRIGSYCRNIRQTRASVLVERGRFSEAKALFKSTAEGMDSDFERALVSFFMMRIELGLKNPKGAKMWFDQFLTATSALDTLPTLLTFRSNAERLMSAHSRLQ